MPEVTWTLEYKIRLESVLPPTPAKKLNNFVGGKAMQLVNILFYRGVNVHCACKFTML